MYSISVLAENMLKGYFDILMQLLGLPNRRKKHITFHFWENLIPTRKTSVQRWRKNSTKCQLYSFKLFESSKINHTQSHSQLSHINSGMLHCIELVFNLCLTWFRRDCFHRLIPKRHCSETSVCSWTQDERLLNHWITESKHTMTA